jgi:hypothetical protein
VNTAELKKMRLMGLSVVMGVGLCALIVWDQTRSSDGDADRLPPQQATISQPAEPAEPAEPPASDAAPAPDADAASPAEGGTADGEVLTLTM